MKVKELKEIIGKLNDDADVRGRPLPRGVFRVDDGDWNILEVQRRRDGCPVWAMVRETPQ